MISIKEKRDKFRSSVSLKDEASFHAIIEY